MKVIFIIENLGSGGAQKQLFLLVKRLIQKKIDIKIICYNTYGLDFYSERIQALGIEISKYSFKSYLKRIMTIRAEVLREAPDVVVSFLYGANILATLIKVTSTQKFKLIVADRTGVIGDPTLKDKLRYQLYRAASHVITNSSHTAEVLRKRAPWLKKKIEVIWNIVEPVSNSKNPKSSHSKDKVKLLHGASYGRHKNHFRFIQAVGLVIRKYGVEPGKIQLECYGSKMLPGNKEYMQKLQDEIYNLGLEESITLFDETNELQAKIAEADFCILPSLYEGCPNFIIEAMTFAKPVIVSNVCSIPDIVSEYGGYFFDPESEEQMAKAIKQALDSDEAQRFEMGRANYERAGVLFDADEKTAQYLQLFGINQ